MTVKQGSAAHDFVVFFTFRKQCKHLHSYDFVKLSFSVLSVRMIRHSKKLNVTKTNRHDI